MLCMTQEKIRNFCIIAHIDHGKSTLADRMLELTDTVSNKGMQDQFLDKLDLERERGITIKLQAVRMQYQNSNGDEYALNLIDTPGHVDFSYEVTRSLAACEGALLLVDATQGIQAQTLAHAYKAIEQGLEIIPVINKVDLGQADVEGVTRELIDTFGFKESEIVQTSGKTGLGVEVLLDTVIERIPAPVGDHHAVTQALVFDSFYDAYRGVVAMVRMVNGHIAKGDVAKLIHSEETFDVLDVGYVSEKMVSAERLRAGEVGFLVTGIKEIGHVPIGDTVTLSTTEHVVALPGYKTIQPLVYASLFPVETNKFEDLRDALEKLSLNDSAITYEPVSSKVLGFGFRCGFLGLLHVDIIKERIERELHVDVIVTTPTVSFRENQELWVQAHIIAPKEYIGSVMQLCHDYRGRLAKTASLPSGRVNMTYELPLLSIMTDFYDSLKSVSSGYASFEYEVIGYRDADVVQLSILINGQEIDALTIQTVKDLADSQGKKMVAKLKELIPRQQFKLPIQAAVDGKIIARADVPAVRKDVTAKLYGGDRTRKDKLLEKQKKGKKRLKQLGQVSVPAEIFRDFIKGD